MAVDARSKMNLVAIETATDVCSVALAQQGRVVLECTLRRPRAHAENLVPMLQDLLRYGGLAPADLDAVAVSMGPGSYTGLRIGVSTAKGLAAAAEARLVGVPSLEAMAAGVAPVAAPGDVVCAAFAARREEAYTAAFRVGASGTLESLAPPTALKAEDVVEWLGAVPTGTLWLAGDGGALLAGGLDPSAYPRLRQLDAEAMEPSAAWVARLGHGRLEGGKAEDLATFEPFYLKAFVAKKRKRPVFPLP